MHVRESPGRGTASPRLLSLPGLGPSHLTRGPPAFPWYTLVLLFSFCLWNNHFVSDSFSDPEPSSHTSTTARPQIRNKGKCTNGQNHTSTLTTARELFQLSISPLPSDSFYWLWIKTALFPSVLVAWAAITNSSLNNRHSFLLQVQDQSACRLVCFLVKTYFLACRWLPSCVLTGQRGRSPFSFVFL